MKPRTLLVLFVLVAGLGAFIWFYERELPSSEERAERAKKVLRLEPDEVDAIEVGWQGRKLRLERVRPPEEKKAAKEGEKDDEAEEEEGEGEAEDGDGENDFEVPPEDTWRIARPLFAGQPARADTAAVTRLLDSVLGLEKARTLEEFDPKQVGLDRPRGTVTLETEDGKKVLSIGAAVPTGAKMIVGLAGAEEAYVVDDAVLADLEREPGDWRDREMFPGERADIQRITLLGARRAGRATESAPSHRSEPGAKAFAPSGGPAGPVVLVRQGEEFRLARPVADRADRDLVDALLTDLAGLRAEQFLDQGASPAELGLEPPQRVVEVAFAGGTPPVKIELGRTDETTELTAARVGRQLFETRTNLAEAVDRGPRAWRSPAWTGLEVFEIDRVRFAARAGTVEVVRAETDWKRGKDLVSFTVVSDVLFAVTAAKADALLTADEARARGIDLGRPTLTIALNGGGPPKGETLTLYAPVADGVPARAGGRDVVLLLPKASADEMQARLADLRQAEPLPPEERTKDGGSAGE
jgi:hypothetical protein